MAYTDGTTPYPTFFAPKAYVAFAAVWLALGGTGSVGTKEFVNKKTQTSGTRFSGSYRDADVEPRASISKELDNIQSALKVSVNEIARCVGVSRQAIYGWKAGAEIKAIHAEKYAQLKDAADVIAAANLAPSPMMLGRKLPGGQTLLEAIAAGRSGRESAATLVSILREEENGRAVLAAKFANRAPIDRGIMDDAPLIFDELG